MFGDVFHGRTVWLSGHTGFKGAWLAEWLSGLGAKVHGFALDREAMGGAYVLQKGLPTR